MFKECCSYLDNTGAPRSFSPLVCRLFRGELIDCEFIARLPGDGRVWLMGTIQPESITDSQRDYFKAAWNQIKLAEVANLFDRRSWTRPAELASDFESELHMRVHRLVRSGGTLCGLLETIWCGIARPVSSEAEINTGDLARIIFDDLEALKDVDLPVQVEIGINSIRRVFESLMDHWGWKWVGSPGGDEFFVKQKALAAQRRRSYHAAVLSFMKAVAKGKTSEEPEAGYLETAKDAKLEGIQPTEPYVTSKATIKLLLESWYDEPCLGPEFPKRVGREPIELSAAIETVRQGIQGTDLESSERSQIPVSPVGLLVPPAAAEPTIMLTPKRQGSGRGANQNRPMGRGAKRISVLSKIECLIEIREWGWTPPQIAKAAGCSSKHAQSLVKDDAEIKAAWKKYLFEGSRKPKPKSKRQKPQMRSNDAK